MTDDRSQVTEHPSPSVEETANVTINDLVRKTEKTKGDIIEFGVWKGNTSLLIKKILEIYREFIPIRDITISYLSYTWLSKPRFQVLSQ